MADRTLRLITMTALLALAGFGTVRPVRAEPIPAPTEALKDYIGEGVVQIDLAPPDSAEKGTQLGFSTWFPFRQAYARPDRMLMVLRVGGGIQAMLASGDTERQYSPATGYVLQRTYKNIAQTSENPMATVRLSMATYANVLRELKTGTILPAENLDELKTKLTARIEELKVLREKLKESQDPADIQRANDAAAEQSRARDDLQQIDIRKAYPCHVVQFQNKDLVQTLFARGLVGDAGAVAISKGKTTVWVTRAEGLPIKIETTDNQGRVSIFFCFTQLKINTGMHPNELTLGNPPGTWLVSATADIKEKNWEEKLEGEIKRQIDLIDRQRRQQNEPTRPVGPKLKK